MKNIDYFIDLYPRSIKYLEELKEDYNFTISLEKEEDFNLETNLKDLGLSDIEIKGCMDNFEQLVVVILRNYQYYKVYYVKKQWVYEFYKHILIYKEFNMRRGEGLIKDIFDKKKSGYLVDSFKAKVMYYDDCIFLSMREDIQSLCEQMYTALFLIDRMLGMSENVPMSLEKFLKEFMLYIVSKENNKYTHIYTEFDANKRVSELEKYAYKSKRLRNGGIKIYEIRNNEFLIVQTVLVKPFIMELGTVSRINEASSDETDFEKSYIGANAFVNDFEFTRGAKVWGKKEWLERMFENVEEKEIQELISNSKFHCVARIYITNYNNRLNNMFPSSKKIRDEYFDIRLDGLYE